MRRKRKESPMQKNVETTDSYLALSNIPSIKLDSGETVSPREWKRRFDSEWYTANRYGKFELIDSKEGQSEAVRNNNANNRDLFSMAEKTKSLVELNDNEHEFMNDASDQWEWKDAYCAEGPVGAKNMIYFQAERDIKAGNIEKALTKFFIRMSELKTLMRREKRKDR